MNYAFAGQLATVVIASAAILVVIVKRAHDWYVKPFTVEAEQERTRHIVGSIPQVYPATRDADEYEAPQWALIDRMHESNSGLM